jgi:hypothetical protein
VICKYLIRNHGVNVGVHCLTYYDLVELTRGRNELKGTCVPSCVHIVLVGFRCAPVVFVAHGGLLFIVLLLFTHPSLSVYIYCQCFYHLYPSGFTYSVLRCKIDVDYRLILSDLFACYVYWGQLVSYKQSNSCFNATDFSLNIWIYLTHFP